MTIYIRDSNKEFEFSLKCIKHIFFFNLILRCFKLYVHIINRKHFKLQLPICLVLKQILKRHKIPEHQPPSHYALLFKEGDNFNYKYLLYANVLLKLIKIPYSID